VDCFEVTVNGDALLNGRSERAYTVVGREKFCRLLVLELACERAYRGRGGGGIGAFCRRTGGVEGRSLLIVRGVESSEEEDSTLRNCGRDVVDCATIGEKLPGALDCGVPVDCDMVAGL